MNFLFASRYKYRHQETVKSIELKMRYAFSGSTSYRPINLKGTIIDDHQFRAMPKFSLTMPAHLAIITGQLISGENQTTIRIIVRPTYYALLAFYATCLALVMMTIELILTDSPDPWIIPLFIGVSLLVFMSLIISAKNRIRKRFERALHVRSHH